MAEIPQQKIAVLEKKVGAGGKSPLFAQLASYYVQTGKAKEALQLCDAGLAAFPHYTTGHLVKGKALLALKMNAEARREFEIVQDFLPANEAVSFILSNIRPGEGESLTAPAAEPVAFEPASDKETSTAVPATTPSPAVEQVETQQEVTTETAVPVTPEEPDGFAPTSEATTQPPNVFGAVETTSEELEDPFGLAGGSGGVATTPTEPVATEEIVDPFAGFPTQPESLASDATPSSDTLDFPAESGFASPGILEEETFEAYANRLRGELGAENSMTLEEYLSLSMVNGSSGQQEPPGSPGETIENLAEKLQTAKKITPVINLSTKTTIPASETDTPASTGFVTPTLAEIYAKQGWYDDAIKAYRTLCINKPAETERFEKRIAELEELKKQQS